MKVFAVALLVLFLAAPILCQANDNFDDNDFAEFDQEFEDEPKTDDWTTADPQKKAKDSNNEANDFVESDDSDDGIVEEEFEHFQDEEEFEGFGSNAEPADEALTPDQKKAEPKLTMAKIPIHFRTHWDSYWLEMIMLIGLIAYFSNYFVGRNKNSKLANMWLTAHRQLLEDNFAMVGDDGKKETDSSGPVGFVKESESLYALWCSGRTCCEGMLVELKMIKRQDLVSGVIGLIRKTQDQVQIKVEISKDSMDNFVLAIATKKSAARLFKDMTDLSKFCTSVAKPDEKYHIPVGFALLSEIQEAAAAIIDSRLIAMLNKYSSLIDFIHISDQFSGPQDTETTEVKQPETKRMLIVSYFIPEKTDLEDLKPLLQLVLHLVDKLKRFRLSKEVNIIK